MVGDLGAVKEFVLKGVNVNKVNMDGNTPLHLAALWGHLKIVEFLVGDCKVSVNTVNNDGETPLHLAAWWDRLDIAQYLVEIGKVNIFMRDPLGYLPGEMSIWKVVAEYLMDCAREQILAAARNALVQLPDEVFMHVTTFLYV